MTGSARLTVPCTPRGQRINAYGCCYLFSNTLGSIVQTTTKLVTINAAATAVMRKILPLLAGNLPRMIQYYMYHTPISIFCSI